MSSPWMLISDMKDHCAQGGSSGGGGSSQWSGRSTLGGSNAGGEEAMTKNAILSRLKMAPPAQLGMSTGGCTSRSSKPRVFTRQTAQSVLDSKAPTSCISKKRSLSIWVV